MLFNSFIFPIFFLLFYFSYWKLKANLRWQNILILIGSYIFYGWWDERFLLLIMLSTVTDFVAGLGITGHSVGPQQGRNLSLFLIIGACLLNISSFQSTGWTVGLVIAYTALGWFFCNFALNLEKKARRKIFLWASMIFNLGLLAVFKYFNFFIDSLSAATEMIGWNLDTPTLSIILPVGISFYTFQTMSYTIDVYRGQLKPTKKFIEFAAFVSFFPQLVAGPIERASHLLPQFMQTRMVTSEKFNSALWLIIWGLYKKIVIADNLAQITDLLFNNPVVKPNGQLVTNGELVAALLAFTFQIYCDFSGYSDIAIGIARLLGFDFMKNFDIPYISKTPSEFWRRWHISLSTWLRDYLYIPLGGNRDGNIATYRNLIITMLLGGLWHGASWLFVLWGAFHGLILAIYRFFAVDKWLYKRQFSKPICLIQDVGLIIIMFGLTCFGWLLFRAPSLETVGIFLKGIILIPVDGFQVGGPFLRRVFYYTWPLVGLQALQLYKGTTEPLSKMPKFIGFNLYLFMIFGIVLLASTQSGQFIYFDF